MPTSKLKNETKSATKPKPRWRRFLRRLLIAFAALLALFLASLAGGMIPVNNDFVPTPDGIEIVIISNPVHSDIVVPMTTPVMDWRTFIDLSDLPDGATESSHIAFGWGDKGFFLDTPTWDDLTVTTAASALLWNSPCCLHVQLMQFDKPPLESQTVTISEQQYQTLVQSIKASFTASPERQPEPITDASYHQWDRFYDAEGNYHALNTCNSWVGRCLKETGVRVPLNPTLPGTPTIYLP